MHLSAATLEAALKGSTVLKAGRHADGNNLYLNVSPSGAMSWLFMYVQDGRRRELGLGSFTGKGAAFRLTLKDARAKADEIRVALRRGVDPLADRRAAKLSSVLFSALLDDVIAGNIGGEDGWKVKDGVCGQEIEWRDSLNRHASKLLAMQVAKVTADDVVAVLKPIWKTIPTTAERIRFRIEKVMALAISKGVYTGQNPARYDGHIENLVGKRLSTKGQKKQPSLHFSKVPEFMTKLGRRGNAALAVAFTTLTAVRTDEARLARWSEIDFDAKLWVIPAERMKVQTVNDRGGDHVVPLSDAALDVLKALPRVEGNDYLFPGQKDGQPLGETSLNDKITKPAAKGGLNLIGEATMHGMRASFRTWASDRGFNADAAELCLAHVIGTKTTRAYNRDEMLEQRAKLLQAWGDYCTGVSNVVALQVAA